MRASAGVSFVVPVYNGATTLDATLRSILAQDDGRPVEVVVVDDGSTDESPALLARWAADPRVRVAQGEGRGAAAALNLGCAVARHPVVAQVDQDVILSPGWLRLLTAALATPGVGAVQGRYVPGSRGDLFTRVMALDLADRYDRIAGGPVDHVCTGNAVYRAEALRQTGGFDESLGYGYDNDLSYRLIRAGWRLRFEPDATSEHRWREGLGGYVRQQFGFGYGRLDLVARHPERLAGDAVSGPAMMIHAPATLGALGALCGAAVAAMAGYPSTWLTSLAVLVLLSLAAERLAAGLRAARRHRDAAGLLFAPVHLLRDVAWCAAIAVWALRHLTRGGSRPADSMRRVTPGPAVSVPSVERTRGAGPGGRRFIAVVPAHNERASLQAVIEELRAACPDAGLVVVDDGSTDGTTEVLEALGVSYVRLGERLGVGGAVRTGLRYARLGGFGVVVRIDGDGQHDPAFVLPMLDPIARGEADAVIGSRHLAATDPSASPGRRAAVRALARLLTRLTGSRVTDPTSGFWAFGPGALRVLADHYPTGYSEPELRLLLGRNGLRVAEVPVRMRGRLGGRTSMTWSRTSHALARTVLALVIVPLRSLVRASSHE